MTRRSSFDCIRCGAMSGRARYLCGMCEAMLARERGVLVVRRDAFVMRLRLAGDIHKVREIGREFVKRRFKGATFALEPDADLWRSGHAGPVRLSYSVDMERAQLFCFVKMRELPWSPKKAIVAGQTIDVGDAIVTTTLEPFPVASPPVELKPARERLRQFMASESKPARDAVCRIETCNVAAHAKGLCPVHYRQSRRPEVVKRAA